MIIRRNQLVKIISLLCMTVLVLGGCGQKNEGMLPEGNMMPGGFGNNGQDAETISWEEVERLDITDMFSDRDKESVYDEATAIPIMLNGDNVSCSGENVDINGSVVTITGEGTYVLSGSLKNGSIVVDSQDTDKLQLVLKDADITCASSAAIYIKQADKVFITLAENTDNHLAVAGEFVAVDDNNVDAAVFAKADLTFNGSGNLIVECPKGHGIVTKDDLVIIDGNYKIDAGDKTLNGKDSVRIANGNFVLNAGDDGIYSEHDEDYEKGFVYIENGNYTINAVGDGIHAGAQNVIIDGNIVIEKCEEGLEGSCVDIRGGNITLASTDDGINASIPDQFEAEADNISCYICIFGGNVDITAFGDGMDANGNLYIFDGVTQVSGPESSDNGSIDYDGVGQITGGVVIAAGFGGMAQNFGNASTQSAVTVNLSETQQAGTEVKLEDAAGNELICFVPKASYNCVTISIPELKVGEVYTLTTGTESQDVELTSLIQGGMHGGMPGGPRPEGGMFGGERPEMPEGVPEMPQGQMPKEWNGKVPGGEKPQGTSQ